MHAAPLSYQDETRLWRKRRGIHLLNLCLIVLASIVVVRSWIANVRPYISLSLYAQGLERLPYQGRFLMMIPMRLSEKAHWVKSLCSHFHSRNLSDPLYMAIFLVSVPALLVTFYCVTWLYRSFSASGSLSWLVPWICIYAVQSTYVVRYEQSWMYPYDFTALAFFAAGLCLIRGRQFLLFILVFIVGTLNRETMLFLLPVFAVELYAGGHGSGKTAGKVAGNALATGLLAAAWFGIRLVVRHHFHNLPSEENSHLINNLQFLRHVQDWPEMASTCGFLWAPPILFWSKLGNDRLKMYLVALFATWVPTMFVYGMITEARIFGELITILVPSAMILFEELIRPEMRHAAVPR